MLSVLENIDAPVRILHLSFQDYLLNIKNAFHADEKETQKNSLTLFLCYGLESQMQYLWPVELWNSSTQVYNGRLLINISQQTCNIPVTTGCIIQSRARPKYLRFYPVKKEQSLHWLEAMSLMGIIQDAVSMVNTLQSHIGVMALRT